MRRATLPLCLLLFGCASHHFPVSVSKDVEIVPADRGIEVAVDSMGRVLEVEFHCRPDVVPQAAMRAVESVVPGGEILDCEKEYHGGVIYYEVSKRVDGREVEVMVTPEGRIHRREIQVMASQVPDVVLESAGKTIAGATRTQVEEIRGGANELLEYHVKVEHSGVKYKIVLTIGGKVTTVLRETMAEIEIPVNR